VYENKGVSGIHRKREWDGNRKREQDGNGNEQWKMPGEGYDLIIQITFLTAW